MVAEIERLKKEFEDLEKEKVFYEDILEKVSAFIFVTDVDDQKLLWINEGVFNILGFEAKFLMNNEKLILKKIKRIKEPDEENFDTQKVDVTHQILFIEDANGIEHAFYTSSKIIQKGHNGIIKNISYEVVMEVNEEFMNKKRLKEVLTEQTMKLNQYRLKNLTKTEIKVIKEVASGKSTKEIADFFNRSTHTIETHRKNIFSKLNINTTTELVNFAYSTGLC